MKGKTIKIILNKKFNEWVESIDNNNLKKIIKTDTIITGGSIVSLLLNEKPKDFDIYFRHKDTALEVAKYYVEKFNSKHKNKIQAYVLDGDDNEEKENIEPGRIKIIIKSSGVLAENENILKEDFEDVYDVLDDADDMPAEKLEEEKEKYRPIFLSSNAITLSNQIQIIIRFYGEPEEIHSNYDFVHCTCFWTSFDDKLVLPSEALETILSKTLIYMGSKYPVCSVIRTRKFIKRGWNINAGQYLKMLFQISKLDLSNIDVLEDQLVGVDSAFFMNLIESLKRKIKNDEDFVIGNEYICSIIDKIF